MHLHVSFSLRVVRVSFYENQFQTINFDFVTMSNHAIRILVGIFLNKKLESAQLTRKQEWQYENVIHNWLRIIFNVKRRWITFYDVQNLNFELYSAIWQTGKHKVNLHYHVAEFATCGFSIQMFKSTQKYKIGSRNTVCMCSVWSAFVYKCGALVWVLKNWFCIVVQYIHQ